MSQQFHAMALVVRDYDEAIEWYTKVLDFELLEDTPREPGKRWVRVAPRGSQGACFLLARALNDEQLTRVGNQTGGRVFLFLHTDNFAGDYARMKSSNVRFCEEPRHEEYGSVVVFEDLYGNRWDLIEPKY
ncbi:MAG TPA: VOC family protein [Dokdonella sp.]|uniref:VOC family protein n=1 Tax=Dokdonella sp. TaxID=2291710 RepID=UPI002D7F05F7|nr:VOC family protein [Dokdonella sp.]HET9031687.1 VOC family protein [Dokdonella sp.]